MKIRFGLQITCPSSFSHQHYFTEVILCKDEQEELCWKIDRIFVGLSKRGVKSLKLPTLKVRDTKLLYNHFCNSRPIGKSGEPVLKFHPRQLQHVKYR